MRYDQIKARIRQASRLIDAGDMAGADKIIRETPGITRADLDANLAPSDMEKLRRWAKSRKTPRRGKKTSRRKNVGSSHPEYHRRNVILDQDLALKVMDYHGGQGSMAYSLASTAYAGDLVSPSMIAAALDELEPMERKLKGKDRRELEDLTSELHMILDDSTEHTYKAATGDDVDSGYATWLMDRENNPTSKKKLKNSLMR